MKKGRGNDKGKRAPRTHYAMNRKEMILYRFGDFDQREEAIKATKGLARLTALEYTQKLAGGKFSVKDLRVRRGRPPGKGSVDTGAESVVGSPQPSPEASQPALTEDMLASAITKALTSLNGSSKPAVPQEQIVGEQPHADRPTARH